MAIDAPVDVTDELPLAEDDGVPAEAPSRWRRHRVAIVVVAVIVLAGAGGLAYWLSSGSSTPTGLVVTTQVVPVTTGTIQQTVTSSGTIEPARQAILIFAVSGTVTAKRITVGVVGSTYTQVLSGLHLGQSVVLADYSRAVPSSNTNTFGGLGELGGGGFQSRFGGAGPGAFSNSVKSVGG